LKESFLICDAGSKSLTTVSKIQRNPAASFTGFRERFILYHGHRFNGRFAHPLILTP